MDLRHGVEGEGGGRGGHGNPARRETASPLAKARCGSKPIRQGIQCRLLVCAGAATLSLPVTPAKAGVHGSTRRWHIHGFRLALDDALLDGMTGWTEGGTDHHAVLTDIEHGRQGGCRLGPNYGALLAV